MKTHLIPTRKNFSLINNGQDSGTSGQALSLELLDLQTSLRNKDNEIMALKRKIAELEYRLTTAETRAAEAAEAAEEAKVIEVNPEVDSAAEEQAADKSTEDIVVEPEASDSDVLSTEDKVKLLEIKTRAQEVKNYYLKYLVNVGN